MADKIVRASDASLIKDLAKNILIKSFCQT